MQTTPIRGRTFATSALEHSAIWNGAQTHRYLLSRDFGSGSGTLHFLMLNPSGATSDRNDATVNKCERYAQRWGYRHLLITNAFAAMCRYPADLAEFADPVGTDNNHYILRAISQADRTVCAWGDGGAYLNRSHELRQILARYPLYALRVNASGEPAHPLYLPAVLTPQPYNYSVSTH